MKISVQIREMNKILPKSTGLDVSVMPWGQRADDDEGSELPPLCDTGLYNKGRLEPERNPKPCKFWTQNARRMASLVSSGVRQLSVVQPKRFYRISRHNKGGFHLLILA
jgi:hypothetical protein